MKHYLRSALAAAAALTAAACANDSPPTTVDTTPSTVSFDKSPDAGSDQAAANRHLHELRDSDGDKAAKSAGKGGGGSASNGISYHGGPVLQAGTNVAAVYWASAPIYTNGPAVNTTGAGSTDASLVGYFMAHLGGSPYFNINTTYTDGSKKNIVNSVTYTQYWANGSYNVPSGTQSVTDAQMIAMLQYGFDHGMLTYNANTLYAIFTAGQVNLGGGFGGRNFQYCAYHTHGTVKVGGVSKTVLYAAMPYDAAYPSSCTAYNSPYVTPNGDFGADAEVNTLGHEIEETTTDLLGTAWYDSRGYENADKCAWMFGTTFPAGGSVANVVIGTYNFLVQMNWVNANGGGCLNHYP